MKIVLVFRKQRAGAYSIETLFRTIAQELCKNAEIVEYETGPRWKLLMDAWRLWKMRADVYHVTGDVQYFIMFLPRDKSVLTVPDIGHYQNGLRGVKRFIYKWLWLILPIRMAKVVTTISRNTLERIRIDLGIKLKGIVVNNCCYNHIFLRTQKEFDLEKPVILQVGTQPNKNLDRVIEAIKEIRCRLLIIGPLDQNTVHKLNESAIEYENHKNLTIEEVFKHYTRADIMCFVSTYEGFGMPIIEANAVGLPVVTSNIPPMSDVAGDSACLVNPFDTKAIRDGILQVIHDPAYRKKLVESGFSNAERYSPAIVALQYFSLYHSVAKRVYFSTQI